MNALVIAKRELRLLFFSPLAWLMLGVVEALLAGLFLSHLNLFLQHQAELAALEESPGATEIIAGQVFRDAAMVLMLVVPLFTAHSVSSELRAETLPPLPAPLESPVESPGALVLGKFLGLALFATLLILPILLMPLSLQMGGVIDLGLLAAGGVGLFLLTFSFIALGVFASALTRIPALAALASFSVLLFLSASDWVLPDQVGGMIMYLSPVSHYDALIRGVFTLADVAYYVLFTITFLVLAMWRLDVYRLRC